MEFLAGLFRRALHPVAVLRGVERVVVGLGNCGPRYQGTRHNVGFAVVDEAARRLSGAERVRIMRADVVAGRWSHGARVALLKPRTYVNRSGESVSAVLRHCGLGLDACLVVVDDINLPLGALRLRRGGSDGGHNGLKSIIAGSGEGFPRVRVGIGPVPRGVPLVEFVLSRFGESERVRLAAVVARAADAVACVLEEGVDTAMNRYNERSAA